MHPRFRIRFVVAALSLAVGSAWACYWGTLESVHFYNSYADLGEGMEKIDFGQLPQQFMTQGWNNLHRRAGIDHELEFAPDANPDFTLPQLYAHIGSGQYGWASRLTGSDLDDSSPATQRAKERILMRARDLERKGHAKAAIPWYVAVWGEDHGSFIRSRVDLISASKGDNSPALQTYLRSTYLAEYYNRDNSAELRKLLQGSLPPYLGRIIANELPDPNVESKFQEAKGLLDWKNPANDRLGEAAHTLRQILVDHPNTTKKGPIYGWLGRAEFLQKNFLAALACYKKQLDLKPTPHQRWMAHTSMFTVYGDLGRPDMQIETMLGEWLSYPNSDIHVLAGKLLRQAFPNLSPSQAKRLQRDLRQNPDLLAVYIGFRIEDTKLTARQERALFRFASSSLQKLPHASPLLVLRTGQASYNAGLYADARDLASRVLSHSALPNDIRARARFLKAGSLARLGHPEEAISVYRQLLASKPRVYLAQSATEHLALLEERYGDPLKALALYRKLGYDWDYAFLADAKLTPAQLNRAAEQAPAGEVHNVLLYTLAMRYMRLERYEEAKQTWRRLGTLERFHFGLTPKHFKDFYKNYSEGSGFDDFPALPDPLLTASKLARWQAASHTGSSEKRAQALYLAASYIYDHRDLLFYSPALWQFERSFALGDLNWSKGVNNRADEQARRRHMYEHECYSQAFNFCKQIVENYPHTSVAPKALYTGGISIEHLTHLNASWSEMDYDHNMNIATRYLRELARRFPNDPLAKKAGKYADVFNRERNQKHWAG